MYLSNMENAGSGHIEVYIYYDADTGALFCIPCQHQGLDVSV